MALFNWGGFADALDRGAGRIAQRMEEDRRYKRDVARQDALRRQAIEEALLNEAMEYNVPAYEQIPGMSPDLPEGFDPGAAPQEPMFERLSVDELRRRIGQRKQEAREADLGLKREAIGMRQTVAEIQANQRAEAAEQRARQSELDRQIDQLRAEGYMQDIRNKYSLGLGRNDTNRYIAELRAQGGYGGYLPPIGATPMTPQQPGATQSDSLFGPGGPKVPERTPATPARPDTSSVGVSREQVKNRLNRVDVQQQALQALSSNSVKGNIFGYLDEITDQAAEEYQARAEAQGLSDEEMVFNPTKIVLPAIRSRIAAHFKAYGVKITPSEIDRLATQYFNEFKAYRQRFDGDE